MAHEIQVSARHSLHHWNRLAAAVCVLLALSPALARAEPITRVDASRLSCPALKDIISQRGAVIVRSRSRHTNLPLSDRYVSDRRFCFYYEVTDYRWVTTRETQACQLKYCTEPIRNDNWFLNR